MNDGIFIGRFQPPHLGHINALKTAASQCSTLYVLVGSSNQCRSIKNPWTFDERKVLLNAELKAAGVKNYKLVPLNDYRYSDTQWMADVRSTIEFYGMKNPVLFGHMKEGNSYLEWFPELNFHGISSQDDINATSIRETMFKDRSPTMPETVQSDWDYYQSETERFALYPYPETLNFNCADVVLECQGHILLIKRKFSPGKGTWALPGGFKNRNETFLDCAIRELFEETNLRVPEKVVRGSIVSSQLFDDPARSFGIPRNTLAVYIRVSLNPDGSFPRANGCDDASMTEWVPLSDALNRVPMYDDHKDIISKLTGVMPVPAFARVKV